jgi:aminoglycoside phosphotransferase (APT) family kinase protein
VLDPTTVRWAERAVSPMARCVSAARLGPTGPWLVHFEDGDAQVSAVLRVGDATSAADRQRLRVEASALVAADRCGVAAPRLIAARLDHAWPGEPALLSTMLPGVNTIPSEASDRRLLELGAAVASLSLAPLAVDDLDLPVLDRPLSHVDFGDPASPLLRAASLAVAAWRRPVTATVVVHGDCWQGNLMWSDDAFSGFVDWEAAGIGPPGLDLASVRFDAALYFGVECLDVVTRGWLEAGAPVVDDLAYWDLVAALASPVDLASWMTVIRAPGRDDLSVDTVTSRRDDFVDSAMAAIGTAGRASRRARRRARG